MYIPLLWFRLLFNKDDRYSGIIYKHFVMWTIIKVETSVISRPESKADTQLFVFQAAVLESFLSKDLNKGIYCLLLSNDVFWHVQLLHKSVYHM